MEMDAFLVTGRGQEGDALFEKQRDVPVLPCEPAPVNEGELPPGYAVLLAEQE